MVIGRGLTELGDPVSEEGRLPLAELAGEPADDPIQEGEDGGSGPDSSPHQTKPRGDTEHFHKSLALIQDIGQDVGDPVSFQLGYSHEKGRRVRGPGLVGEVLDYNSLTP